MPERQSKSFAEVTFIEASARRLRVDLVLTSVVPQGERRLISRFLGIESPRRIILAPPETAGGRKVFVPAGWVMGMSFDLANVWFQASTTVLEHCMFQQSPTCRVDALAVEQPTKLLSANRRGAPRHEVDAGRALFATIWSTQRVTDENLAPLVAGRLQDWSEKGLGVRLGEPLNLTTGQGAVIRLESPAENGNIFLQGVLRHCTPLGDGNWLAGFGNVGELRPGEALSLMSFLAASRA
jgi:hypothetical protein